MKHLFFAVSLALLCHPLLSAKVVPYFSIRSQSENAARELVLWQTQVNLFDHGGIYGSFSVTPEYTHSFKSHKLAEALFADVLTPDDGICSPHFTIQGSLVESRQSTALLADYFGLPTDYESIVAIKPSIENMLVDFNLYLGLDRWLEGLYIRAHAPVVNTRWNLHFNECNIHEGKNSYPTGYFNNAILGSTPNFYGAARTDLIGTFEGFVAREEVVDIQGITFQPLEKARMYTGHKTKTGLSEVQVALGWNFILDDDYHYGLNIRGSIPTGTRPSGKWLFEPIVGNGKHGELGAGFTAHWNAWHSADACKNFSIYTDANITHLFKTSQCRTFDLCGKPFSRYMLAELMTQPVEHLVNDLGNKPTYQFDNEFTPVANLSTIPVEVTAAVQADIVIKLAYTHHNFQVDVGYEFWARSCEKIYPIENCCDEVTFWALKGDAFVYGFAELEEITPVPLSATENNATIFNGTNNPQRTGNVWVLNPSVDNAQEAFYQIEPDQIALSNYVNGTLTPMASTFNLFGVFNSKDRGIFDITGAQTKGLSNKLFCNIGYVRNECLCYTPYIGLGAEVEFGIIDTCQNSCCPQCALSQWGVWVKGGISFH